MRPRRHRNDFFSDDEGLNPMDYVSNLSDVMLILAVGIMLALIVHWNVDITPTDAASDPLQAEAAFTEEELDSMRDDATESPDALEKRGELYYDAETGTYYIVESGNGARKTAAEDSGAKTPRYALRFAVLLAVFLVIFVGSFPVGRYALSVRQIFSLIASRFVPVEPCWPAAAENVIFEIRFPRVAAAALIGAALSLAGVSYQGMFRNPMVSPDISGASTGAGFGAAIAILLGADYFLISASSFGFGLLAVLAAYLLSRCSKTNPTLAMILSGMMISSLFQAGTSLIKLVADTQQQLPAITYWLMGSLSSIKIEDVKFLCIPVALGALPLFILSWRLNLLTVGDEEARTLGVNTTALRAIVVVCATLLTAASVAVSGMIGWVGLVIPHFCRMIFGYDCRRLIPASALFGAAYLVLVDDVARLVTTQELPLGILTAFVGAPIFVYLVLTGGGNRD